MTPHISLSLLSRFSCCSERRLELKLRLRKVLVLNPSVPESHKTAAAAALHADGVGVEALGARSGSGAYSDVVFFH